MKSFSGGELIGIGEVGFFRTHENKNLFPDRQEPFGAVWVGKPVEECDKLPVSNSRIFNTIQP